MRIVGIVAVAFLLVAGAHVARAQDAQPVGSMRDVMVSLTYPAANELLLAINRGAPRNDREWAAIQRNAVQLAESGNTLMMRGRTRDGDWNKYARMMVDAGAAAYKAAATKDAAALASVEAPLNASCTACHKAYRANVHPQGTN
jgi:cytochrome c556